MSAERLRQLFIEAGIADRIQSGDLTPRLLREGDPSPDAHQEEGTKSQYIAYLNRDGKTIAEVHQYVRKDGSLGASGKPDPKMVYYQGVEYRDPI